MSSYGFLYTSSRVLVWSDSAGYCMKFVRPFWNTYKDFKTDVETSWVGSRKYEIVNKDTLILIIGLALSSDYFASKCSSLQDCLNEIEEVQKGSKVTYPLYLFHQGKEGIEGYFLDSASRNKIEKLIPPSYMCQSAVSEPDVMVKEFIGVDELIIRVDGKRVTAPDVYWREAIEKVWSHGDQIFTELSKKYPLFMKPWNLVLLEDGQIKEKVQ